MRKTELERLSVLRAKVESGQELNEKEQTRLEQLEDKLRAEQEKEVENDGGRNHHDGEGNRNNSGSGNSGDGREESREGEGSQRGNRNKSNSINAESSSTVGGSSRPSGNPSGEPRSESRSGSRSGGGNPRGSDGGNRGSDGGTDGNNSSSGNEEGEVVSVKPNQVTTPAPKPVKPKVNPKKSSSSSKKKSDDLEAEDIGNILMAGFGLIASMTGRKHWSITEEEAESVAVPLEDMLSDMSKTMRKNIKKKMAPVMLAGAVAGIVVPRVMTDLYLMRGAKQNVKPIQQQQPTERTTIVNTSGDVTTNIKQSGVTQSEGNSGISQTASPNVDPIITGLINSSDSPVTRL